MSRIRSRGNAATELRFIQLLKAASITGWRRNQKIFGKPDFVFLKFKLAVFVDGCFWHGCPRCYSTPKSNRAFWRRKITTNRKRDLAVKRALRKAGWRVLRIWQHELKCKNESRLLCRFERALK
jgi:DNA mismatch endonuclease (patch repair protein)